LKLFQNNFPSFTRNDGICYRTVTSSITSHTEAGRHESVFAPSSWSAAQQLDSERAT